MIPVPDSSNPAMVFAGPQAEAPSASSLPWRTGGPSGLIAYAQAGEQPADSDPLVAVFFDPAVALEHVREHNGALAGL